jgi:hypothetical protein
VIVSLWGRVYSARAFSPARPQKIIGSLPGTCRPTPPAPSCSRVIGGAGGFACQIQSLWEAFNHSGQVYRSARFYAAFTERTDKNRKPIKMNTILTGNEPKNKPGWNAMPNWVPRQEVRPPLTIADRIHPNLCQTRRDTLIEEHRCNPGNPESPLPPFSR